MTNSPEKSTFSQTCTLLSQYMKERGNFVSGTPELLHPAVTPTSTMSLFPMVNKSNDVSAPRNLRSMDLFPQQAGFGSPAVEDVTNKTDLSANKPVVKEPETAQMTIFYAGQVIVFNDFPAEKAKEITLLASKGSSQSAFAYANSVKSSTDSVISVPPSPTTGPNFGNSLIQEYAQQPNQPIRCDLPIARKASLQRFLEKRKDRIIARSPYQTISMGTPLTKPSSQDKSWLNLAAQFPQ